MGRITITLQEDEQEALWQLAERELRDPREQIRFVLRRELQSRGLLEATEEERREQEIEIREAAQEYCDEVAEQDRKKAAEAEAKATEETEELRPLRQPGC